MDDLKKAMANPAAFAAAYLAFMVPTYILPYFGSNSVLAQIIGAAAGAPLPSALFLMHLACLAVLCVLAWWRGQPLGKGWLISFPIIAMVFDLVPGLNWIPLVPTLMHLLAIILGAIEDRPSPNAAP